MQGKGRAELERAEMGPSRSNFSHQVIVGGDSGNKYAAMLHVDKVVKRSKVIRDNSSTFGTYYADVQFGQWRIAQPLAEELKEMANKATRIVVVPYSEDREIRHSQVPYVVVRGAYMASECQDAKGPQHQVSRVRHDRKSVRDLQLHEIMHGRQMSKSLALVITESCVSEALKIVP
jgi:hypothetical protein